GRQGLVAGTAVTVPRYAFFFDQYGWGVENHGVDPEVEVLITPDDWAAGRDPQLEVAVDRALAMLAEDPPAPPPRPQPTPPPPPPPPLNPPGLPLKANFKHKSTKVGWGSVAGSNVS